MMVSRTTPARHVLFGAVCAGVALLGASLPADAQPKPPNCTAADLSGVMSGITAATSAYLFTHPPVNDFLTNLGDLPADQKQAALGTYLEDNPQTRAELQGIRQPAVDFRDRCGGAPAQIVTPPAPAPLVPNAEG